MQKDDIFIDHEFELVELVKKCIHYHAANGEKVPAIPEEVAGPEVWERLTDDERKARKTAYDNEVKKIKTEQDNLTKHDKAEFHKFTKLEANKKTQFILDITQRDVNRDIKASLVLRPVTETEKIEVFKAIRWSFMTHEQLVETSMDKDFEMARPLILEGLSSRLVNFEKSAKLGQSINLNPRIKFAPTVELPQNDQMTNKQNLFK